MPIVFECEQCGRRYEVAEDRAGRRARSKQCGHVLVIPRASGPTAGEICEIEAEDRPSAPPVVGPPPGAGAGRGGGGGKRARSSGLAGLSSLPPWGFNLYRGAAIALLPVALLAGGVTKIALVMVGMGLCVAPFVASGFSYRFGVAFRDGPIAGLLYMFFTPYRIHYRLTHKELFRKLRAPTLTRHDFSLLLVGFGFLPIVILAAREMDKLGRKPPAGGFDWARFAARPRDAGAP